MRLFQDVYDWAGDARAVDIRKNVEGSEFFVPVAMIQQAAAHVAAELAAENYLIGLGRDRFIERLAHHYDQFNYIHPFREGNGRTQRVFFSRVARDAGWQLDWSAVIGKVNDRVSRAVSEQRDFAPLRRMLAGSVVPATLPSGRSRAWERATLRRSSATMGSHMDSPWMHSYCATLDRI